MSGYTPLFGSIITSSIWNESNETRIVWVTMLAMADMYGIVEGSAPGLAVVARVSKEACQKALEILSSPDPDSRTKEYEGRRIIPVTGGWKVVNHTLYRQRAKSRAKDQKRYREKLKEESNKEENLKEEETQTPNANAKDYGTLRNGELKENKELAEFEKARTLYPGTKRGGKTEFGNFCKKHKDWRSVISLMGPAIQLQIDWRKSARGDEFRPAWKHFSTWINNRCWEEEVPHKETTAEIAARYDAEREKRRMAK